MSTNSTTVVRTQAELVEFLARGTVKKMRIATEWKAANE